MESSNTSGDIQADGILANTSVETLDNKFTLPIMTLPTRDTAPFLYDIGSRTLKGALTGFTLGLIFFKGYKTRRFCTYYGAGFGLGLSYS